MIISIADKILEIYKRPEEYLVDHYPENYFNFYIDIGARGIKHPWHMNTLAKNNPETTYIGYEPDGPYYEELNSATKTLENVHMNKAGYGTGTIPVPDGVCCTVSLSDIISEYGLDVDSNWAIKFDCEGCEYSLFELEGDIDILKKANHIALEFHTKDAGKNFFTRTNNLPNNFVGVEVWIQDQFKGTHDIFLSSKESGLRTYVLIRDKIVSEANDLFWNELLP